MEQINTGHWPFDGSITTDVQVEDLTPEVLEYANDRHISLNGTERISGVMHYMWQAAEGTEFALIDEFIAYANINKIPTCVLHDKRPPSFADAVVPEQWVPPVGLERGIVPLSEIDFKTTPSAAGLNPDIAFKGRGMTRSRTTEMLMQLEDDQIAFGLEALNKCLNSGLTPGALSGIGATAYPSDLEERRAAFAAEQSSVEIKTVKGLHETKSGGKTFQVVCDETNNPPDVVATGDLNVDILLDMNHVSAKLSDMGISWQGGASQNIDSEYAIGYAKHILQLRDDHGVEPEPVTLIDGKLVADDTKKQNHARVIDLFRYAADVGLGDFSGQRPPYESNMPKGSQIVMAYDVSIYKDTSVKTVMRKDADGNMHVLSTHTISALDVARITDKQNRQMQHAETAELLTDMRKESGSLATVSPAYVAAMNAQDARKKQKKVKTKNRNKRAKR